MKLRIMTPSDIRQGYQLWKKAGLDVVSYKREKLEVKNVLKLNSSSCFVMEDKGNIIGTVLGAFNGRRAWIYHMAIHPDHQRKGNGWLLLQKTEEALKKLGATKILVGVLRTNKKALDFYQKHNFSIMDDALALQKDLWSK